MAEKERRRDRRVQVPVSIKYRVTGRDFRDTWFPAVLVNLAAGGLRFSCDRLIGEGDRVEFEVRLPTREKPYALSGVVVWVAPLAGGVDCGVVFSEASADVQFEINELVEFLNTNVFRKQFGEDAD